MGVALRDARRSVTSWCRRHTIGGDGAVAAARRGQRPGEPGTLSREEELELIDVLRGTYPDTFGLTDELWTRQSLAALVQRRFDRPLDATDLGAYLRAWGVGPREPRERACGLCVDAVERWVRVDYPAISRAAQEHGAEIYWIGRIRLRGTMPAADVISAVSARGRVRFMITTPSVDPPLPRDFLLRLSGEEGDPVHVIVDGSWPRGEWPRRLPARITLHPLPSCGRLTPP
ncbi:winged helix-turn-helix domain-containing protein [Micromonospora echinofusca]|uniref:Winged helix-turn-helix domain-containing protein n=1 Tax=Micromonospora echinofusca TaxID=47858 RepID=A0ABS3VYE4_MICEH|nr:winged helix-turn-helix domain-containing protein [Micromonospora echinofusca]MBO4209562.1 winged helix-turn-helix domain-containing protein [Micromonospora echinofusca]